MTDALTLIAQVALEHPIPIAVGLCGLVLYIWHGLAESIAPAETPIAEIHEHRDRLVFDAVQRAKAAGVVRVDFKTGRKVG